MRPRWTDCATLLLLAMGCRAGAAPPAVADRAPRDEHVVHSQRLQRLMVRLNGYLQEQAHTELEIDKRRAASAPALAEAAAELAASARELTANSSEFPFDEARRARFIELAEALAVDAGALAQSAAEQDWNRLALQQERMSHACARCHSLFRPDGAAAPVR